MRDVWRSVAIECGELFVMTSGAHQMLKLSADNWDIQQLVNAFTLKDNRFTCTMTNHTGAQALASATFGQGTGPIQLDDVQCTGTESRLFDCTFTTVDNCVHAEDAGVRCQGCRTGDVRLVGGTSTSEGRVEICQTNVWGTVCDDFWGTPDATVVCRQLGFSAIGAIARTRAFFGAGTGNIFLDDVQCTGTEAALSDCQASSTHNCVHSEDAGVICNATC